jgi:NitT/TauT family transport system permease protein
MTGRGASDERDLPGLAGREGVDPAPPVPSAPEPGDPGAIEAALALERGADELAVEAEAGVEAVVGRWSSPLGRFLRTALAMLAFLAAVALAWEAFKWLFGDRWRLENVLGTGIDYFHDPPFRLLQASDRQLPHLWDIAAALWTPFQRGSDVTLLQFLVESALFTLRQAVAGFGLGALIGIVLASVFVHSGIAERAFMPWVVASQTVPIVALAPMIVIAFGFGIFSVIVVATYLTFFPVTIAQLRGLRSPDPRALELMRSYGASRWAVYWKLRLPASVPYLFTALKVAASAAIVGAIIGEGPGGVKEGLGKAIVSYNQQYITGPEKLWATILVAGLAGICFFLAVRVAEVVVLRSRQARRS